MTIFGIKIEPSAIRLFSEPVNKREALQHMADAVVSTGRVSDRKSLLQAIYDREAVMSTGVGSGVAIPHVCIPAVISPVIGIGISREGIEFDTLDNKRVHIIVLFAMPSGSQKEYLSLLARVMLALKTPGFKERLLQCTSSEEVAHLVNADTIDAVLMVQNGDTPET